MLSLINSGQHFSEDSNSEQQLALVRTACTDEKQSISITHEYDAKSFFSLSRSPSYSPDSFRTFIIL